MGIWKIFESKIFYDIDYELVELKLKRGTISPYKRASVVEW